MNPKAVLFIIMRQFILSIILGMSFTALSCDGPVLDNSNNAEILFLTSDSNLSGRKITFEGTSYYILPIESFQLNEVSLFLTTKGFQLEISIDRSEKDRFLKVTREQKGQKMGIMKNGLILTVAKVKDEISEGVFLYDGGKRFSIDEAKNMKKLLEGKSPRHREGKD